MPNPTLSLVAGKVFASDEVLTPAKLNQMFASGYAVLDPSAAAWPVSIGGTGASTAAGARANLGMANYQDFKHKLDATVDPGASDDSSDGYSLGSFWFNVTKLRVYVCLDPTTDAATWREYAPYVNRGASRAPNANDDIDAGYVVGSWWLRSGGNGVYVCSDNTADNAVWERVDNDAVETPKCNYAATSDPAATDDEPDGGYEVGSVWVNTSTGNVFDCVDATDDAAVWKQRYYAASLYFDVGANEQEVSGGAVADIDISDLDLQEDGTYWISGELIDAGVAGDVHMFFKAGGAIDTTATNYDSQKTQGGANQNVPYIGEIASSKLMYFNVWVHIANGYVVYHGISCDHNIGTGMNSRMPFGQHNVLADDPMSQIRLHHSGGSGFANGSKVRIKKILD